MIELAAPAIVTRPVMALDDPRLPPSFWRMVSPEPNSGCWLHLGSQVNGGYTRARFNGRRMVSHKVTWLAAGGIIPPDLELDHICRVTCCCNVVHLRLLTHRENTLIGNTVTAANAAATHCKHGHEFTPENTARYKHGDGGTYRRCKICERQRYAVVSPP